MAVNFIDVEQENEQDLPWLNEWKGAKKAEGTAYTALKLLLRPKGLMVFTSSFKVFIWKSSKAHNQILEHVGKALTPDNPLEALVIVPVASTKYGYVPGFDDEIKGSWDEENLNYTFRELLTVPSESLSLDLQGSGMVDSSPKTGRRAS